MSKIQRLTIEPVAGDDLGDLIDKELEKNGIEINQVININEMILEKISKLIIIIWFRSEEE